MRNGYPFGLSEDVCEEKAREMKKGEREDPARSVRCGRARLGIAIRNAAVAVADHSVATARIAISWRVLGQDFVRPSNVSSPSHTIRIINTRISLSRKRFIPQLGVPSPLQIRTWIENKPRTVSRPLPIPFPSPSSSPPPPSLRPQRLANCGIGRVICVYKYFMYIGVRQSGRQGNIRI